MAIGSNYAGAKALQHRRDGAVIDDGIYRSVRMTETPLVIVNTMRGGPSTGLPTKQEQADLNQMIYGTRGYSNCSRSDRCRGCFYSTIDAFNWLNIRCL